MKEANSCIIHLNIHLFFPLSNSWVSFMADCGDIKTIMASYLISQNATTSKKIQPENSHTIVQKVETKGVAKRAQRRGSCPECTRISFLEHLIKTWSIRNCGPWEWMDNVSEYFRYSSSEIVLPKWTYTTTENRVTHLPKHEWVQTWLRLVWHGAKGMVILHVHIYSAFLPSNYICVVKLTWYPP